MRNGKTWIVGAATIFACLLVMAASVLAATSWQQTSGPAGGKIQALAIDPSNRQVVYAGTNDGVFKSTNGGAAWTPIITGIGPSRISALAVDPSNGQTVYAGTAHGGAYKSTDGGATWNELPLQGLDKAVYSVAVVAGNPQVIYVATGQGLYRSTDGGATWSDSLTFGLFHIPLPVYYVAADPTNSTVYAASAMLLKSTDGGNTWSQNGSFSPVTVAIDPKNSLTVYAGTMNEGVYKSTDGGTTWSAANTGIPAGSGVFSVAIDRTSNTVYAGTNYSGESRVADGTPVPVHYSSVYKSADGGLSWNSVNAGLTNTEVLLAPGLDYVGPPLAIDPVDGQTAYTGTSDGVFKTTNGAASWVPVKNGLIDTEVNALAVDPASSQTVYAGTSTGMFKSTDGGGLWNALHVGDALTTVLSVAVDPQNSQTVYAAGSDYNTASWIAKSTDGGGTWNEIVGVNAVSIGTVLSSLVIDPDNTQNIYLGRVSGTPGIFKSSDGGMTWNAANSGLPADPMVLSLALDPTNAQTLYAGLFEKGVYKSTDGGGTWMAVNTGFALDSLGQTAPIAVFSLAVDPTNSQVVYAGVADQNITPILYKTSNGGASWSAAGTVPSDVPAQSLVVDPRTGAVFAGTMGRGIFQSTDGGASWGAMNGGLFNLVHSLAIDPSGSGTIYAGTSGSGVFRSVPTSSAAFGDVAAASIYAPYIAALANTGITRGCGGGNYCPGDNVTRGQMAAFIERALHGENFSYTATPYFADVPADNPYFKYVQRLKDDGITAVTGNYDVDGFVTRGQMAAFLVRSKLGETFSFTATPYFSDVPADNVFFKYVQTLKDSGVTASVGVYNVDNYVTREQMAAFLSRAFLGMQ